MPAPIKWKSKIVLVKMETTYGVDAAPTGAANAVLMVGVSLVPMEGDDVSRDLEFPWLSAQAMIPTGLRVRLRGRIELAPSGIVGTAPAWGPLLRAAAVAQVTTPGTSVVFGPITDNHESATVHFWIGGTRHVMRGARGTGTVRVTAQGIPYFEVDLLGLFSTPSEIARPVPDLTAFKKPRIATTANTPVFTINGVALVMRSFAMNLGNVVEPRLLVGSESIIIPDRAELVQTTVEATPVTFYDPYTLAEQQTTVPIALTHGTTAGNRWALSIPTAQQKRLASLSQNQNLLEWPLEFVPLPVSGNDQWSLSLT